MSGFTGEMFVDLISLVISIALIVGLIIILEDD